MEEAMKHIYLVKFGTVLYRELGSPFHDESVTTPDFGRADVTGSSGEEPEVGFEPTT
jgi:hypothetical protein